MFENWRERKWRNKGINKQQQPDSGIHDTSAHCPRVYQVSIFSRPHRSGEKCDEKFQCWKLERKTNEEIKGWICSSSLIPVYMIHLPTVHVCTNFQTSRPHSFREKRRKISMLKIWAIEKWRNEGTNEQQQPDSSKHDTSAHCPRVYQISIF